MSDTGGGHRAAAEAIAEAFGVLYGNSVRVTIVDAWKDYMGWPVNRLANSYPWIVNRAMWLWRSFWRLEKSPFVMELFFGLFYPLVAPRLLRLFTSQRPGVIVSVHPLLTAFSLRVLERSGVDIPFVTVVTDLVKSWQVWYRASTTLCLVPTADIGQQAARLGVSPAKIEVVGQPVTLELCQNGVSKISIRGRLGLDPQRPVILLAGGGEGYGPMFDIARTIARRLSHVQLLVVAGRNRPLQARLQAVQWEVPTRVFGFVPNMPELMQAADLFVTKAGPGSLAEAFVAGLPLLIFDYIPGQEDSNVRYVIEHGAGVYERNPDKIVDLLQQWFSPNDATLAQMAQQTARLAQPNAALDIARRVYTLLTQA